MTATEFRAPAQPSTARLGSARTPRARAPAFRAATAPTSRSSEQHPGPSDRASAPQVSGERAGKGETGEVEIQRRKGPPRGPCSASAGGDRTATGIFNLTLARGPRLRLICHPRPVTVMHFTHCRGRARGEPSRTGRAVWGAGALCPGGGREQKL